MRRARPVGQVSCRHVLDLGAHRACTTCRRLSRSRQSRYPQAPAASSWPLPCFGLTAKRVVQHRRERVRVPGQQVGHHRNDVLVAERLDSGNPQLGCRLVGRYLNQPRALAAFGQIQGGVPPIWPGLSGFDTQVSGPVNKVVAVGGLTGASYRRGDDREDNQRRSCRVSRR
jgi:hypothetical protein